MAVAHKGAISFGLVHIPVSLYRTTQDTSIAFHQLCKDTHERIKYKKYCAHCGKEVHSEDIVKGYEYENDKDVVMSKEELEEIKTEKDKTIHILQFVKLEEVDAIYYEKNYYAFPDKHAEKAYELLRKAMFDKGVVAISKTVIGTKETLLALCPDKQGILVKTLFYEEEIVEMPKDIPHPKTVKAELDMAKQLIQSMTKPFDPSLYHDEYQEKLREAILSKVEGKEVVEANSKKETISSPMDLMEALTKSLATMNKPAKRKAVRH